MADTALSALLATTALASGDLFYVVDGGVSKKVDYDDVVAQIMAASGTITNKTIDTANNTITVVEADISDYDPASTAMARVAGSTYSTIQHAQDIFHSAGHTSGGTITQNGTDFDVAAGTGLIRATDSDVAQLLWFDWSAANTNAIPDGAERYVGVEYNAGSPQVVVKTSYSWDLNTEFPLGKVMREGSDLWIENAPHKVGDHAGLMISRLYETMPLKRDERTGGLILGETGTRNITISAGAIWDRLNRFALAAIDTSATGTFDRYYRDGVGGFTKQSAQTTWDNTQYDDGSGTLATMTNNRWSVQYFYVTVNDNLLSMYGQAEYVSEAAAEADTPPSPLPNRMDEAVLIGRIIFQKSASSAQSVETVFSTTFSGSIVTDHGLLGGLGDDDHTQYVLADGSRQITGSQDFAASTALTWNSTAILSDSAGTMTLSNIDALDATTEATIEAAIDTLSNLTSVGTIGTGVWEGTDVAVLHGGTGASSAPNARTNLGVGTGDSPQFTAVNIGHASDTTLARVSAGLASIEGDTIALLTATQTFTNKTHTNIILDGSVTEEIFAWSTTAGSNTTEFDPANGTVHTLTLTGNMTSVTDNVAAGESFIIGIDDGTAYTFAWPTITWVNNAGSAPTLATTGYTWVAVWKVSTTLYGALIGDGT